MRNLTYKVVPVGLALLCSSPVLAVAGGAPPSPTVRSAPAPFIGFAVMFVLLGLILVPSLMPSKRSHQD